MEGEEEETEDGAKKFRIDFWFFLSRDDDKAKGLIDFRFRRHRNESVSEWVCVFKEAAIWLIFDGIDFGFVWRSMPRGKRRATEMAPAENDRHTSKRQRGGNYSNTRRTTKSDETFSSKRCITWFKEYTTADEPEMLGPDGMERFCKDIGVEPENVVMLVLAYKMGARQMGFFTLAEWQKGLTDVQCDSVAKIQMKLDYLKSLMNDTNVFKCIYRYAYDFARDKDQRSMDIETVI